MNREIKFRAWDSTFKKMLNIVRIDIENNCVLGRTSDGSLKSQSLDITHLLQYTGLKDKNGKEIYEGDIVRKGHYRYGLNPTNELIGVVSFSVEEKGCYYILDPYKYGPSEKDGCTGCPRDIEPSLENYSSRGDSIIEIIGNIYESPELLK